MKKVGACIFIITLFWANTLFAQTSGNASSEILFVPPATCILYRGIKNPVTIVASGLKGAKPTISSGAKIYSGNVSGYDGEYIIEVTDPNVKEVTVSANGRVQKFRVLNVPTPVITIGGYSTGEDVPKAVFKSASKIYAVPSGGFFPYVCNYSVLSYTYMKENRGVVTSYHVTGNDIPKEILDDISKKPSGAVISFVGIKISTPSGVRNTPGFTVKLK